MPNKATNGTTNHSEVARKNMLGAELRGADAPEAAFLCFPGPFTGPFKKFWLR